MGENRRAPSARQIPTQGLAAGLPCPVNRVVTQTQVILVSRLEVRVAGQPHDLEFAEAFGKPVADGRPSQVVELAGLDRRLLEDQTEICVASGGIGHSQIVC